MTYYKVTIIDKKSWDFYYLATRKGLKALRKLAERQGNVLEYARARRQEIDPMDKRRLKQERKGYISGYLMKEGPISTLKNRGRKKVDKTKIKRGSKIKVRGNTRKHLNGRTLTVEEIQARGVWAVTNGGWLEHLSWHEFEEGD